MSTRSSSRRVAPVGGRLALALLGVAAGCLAAPPGPSGGDGFGDGSAGAAEALLVAADPLGDGTAFAHVFGYRGLVYLGPAGDSAGLVRVAPGGSDPEAVSFSLPRDIIGNSSQNDATRPYAGVGYTGCAENVDCGPDNEDGRGLFATGAVDGEEIIVAGGARSGGDLDYLYVTSGSDTTLSFRYIDLSAVLGAASRGLSALHVFHDRVYAGFSDTGGARPYLVVLHTLPTVAPGLDAVAGDDVDNLHADSMPNLKTDGNAIIDALSDFGDRLYVANAGGWMRSTVPEPGPYDTIPSDWSEITPSSQDYRDLESRVTGKTSDLEPADRAVVRFASHKGLLYAARNTVAGPQLWRCDPTIVEPASDCDRDDWNLIARNTSGDTRLSQFNDADLTSVSLLVSTGAYLYVGFDAAEGVVLFRSAVDTPDDRADFEGSGGCSAADHPPLCPGIAGPGLGVTGQTRIFDARALGAPSELYLVVGDGTGPVSAYRMPDPSP